MPVLSFASSLIWRSYEGMRTGRARHAAPGPYAGCYLAGKLK
jgi:hypothetical protein